VNELVVFVSQFLMVFLLGFQQMNVMRGFYFHAALTSFLLGLSGWATITIVSKFHVTDFLTVLFFAYIVAGPLAIVSAMKLHRTLFK
jgi:hypothetical protein